jgi:restriction endonuclease BamHI
MKIMQRARLIDQGNISSTREWQVVEMDIIDAIGTIEWPEGSGSFTLNPQRKGNGVVPIKEAFILHLQSKQWIEEYRLSAIGTGKIDAICMTNTGLFGVEWETGNISSSHRAVNKMALALLEGVIVGGVLILPTREMYNYLTDRIGNFPELQPYFPLWRALKTSVSQGVLEIIAIEHDTTDPTVPLIRKGTDGRALI